MNPVLLAPLALGIAAAPAAADSSDREIFDRLCAHCHAPGNENPGTGQLARTRGEGRAVLAEREDLVAEYVRYVVRNGLKSMPAFYPSDLTEAQLESLAEFLSRKKALDP